MKTIKFKFMLGILSVFSVLFVSCEDDGPAVSAPVIENVSLAQNDSLVEFGFANNMYIVRGKGFTNTQKIYFNDVDTYFNSTLITDEVILVTIDRSTPYENASEELKVVTPKGTAIYHFVVAPPAPGLTSFNPVNAAAGEQFTIYGSYFLDPVVKVGGVDAQIVSSTMTEIVAIMPPDSNGKYVQVTTLSGRSIWSSTAVGTAFYDDDYYNGFLFESWNNHEYVTDQAKAYQGTTYIKKTIPGWDSLQSNWGWYENLSQYTGIHFAVRSDDVGKLVVIFNGNGWGDATKAIATGAEWTDVRLTWAQLGGMPAAFQNLSFQEFTGAPHTYYFDNFGFTVD